MATNFWICYQDKCGYRGTEAEFRHPENGHECPKCKLDDAAFPWRKFRCLGCGFAEEQGKFFATGSRFGETHDADLDPDPIKEKFPYRCSELNNEMCDSTAYEQIDDSADPPKSMLYELRRSQDRGQQFVFDVTLGRLLLTVASIDVKRCPVGMRFTVQTTRYGFHEVEAEAKIVELPSGRFAFHGDALLLEDPFDVKDGKGYGLAIKASNPHLEEYDPWYPLYVPRQDDRTSDQWVKYIFKDRKQGKGKK